ncbi:MAG: hypothetical protein ACXAB0_16135 [Candidatus Thorarchaeota archaeon]
MKNSGQCPKCESSNIWNNLHLKNYNFMHSQAAGWRLVHSSGMLGRIRKYVFKEDYVCLDCGFTESFIEDVGLDTLREYGSS